MRVKLLLLVTAGILPFAFAAGLLIGGIGPSPQPVIANNGDNFYCVDQDYSGFLELEEVYAVIDAYFDEVFIPPYKPFPTPLPTPTPTPPLPTPTPNPGATIFTGSGDTVRDCTLTPGRKIFTITYRETQAFVGGEGYFGVDLYDNEGDDYNLAWAYNNSYNGEKVIFVGPGLYISSGNCTLQVQADGDWSIYVRD